MGRRRGDSRSRSRGRRRDSRAAKQPKNRRRGGGTSGANNVPLGDLQNRAPSPEGGPDNRPDVERRKGGVKLFAGRIPQEVAGGWGSFRVREKHLLRFRFDFFLHAILIFLPAI